LHIASKQQQVVLTEQLFAAAYGPQSIMGRPFYCADASTDAIKAFRSRAYGLNGAVLAATGVQDHGAFVKVVEESMQDAAPGSKDPPASTTYLGGESRIAAPSAGYAHVALAFEGPAGNTPLLNVLKYCLELSSGEGVSAFSSTGLVGLYGGASSANASGITDSLIAALSTSPSADIIKRAKHLAKADALFALESGSKTLAESMTTSILENCTFSSKEMAAAYDGITDAAVTSAMAALLKSNPAMAAVGDISSVPYHATIVSDFK
jgi:predicted Zn-dependent peptidase